VKKILIDLNWLRIVERFSLLGSQGLSSVLHRTQPFYFHLDAIVIAVTGLGTLGGNHAEFINAGMILTDSLRVLTDLTQQLYLTPPYSEWL